MVLEEVPRVAGEAAAAAVGRPPVSQSITNAPRAWNAMSAVALVCEKSTITTSVPAMGRARS